MDPGGGSYIGAVTRTGVRFRGVNVTNVYARGVTRLLCGNPGFETRSALDTSLDDADPGGGVTLAWKNRAF